MKIAQKIYKASRLFLPQSLKNKGFRFIFNIIKKSKTNFVTYHSWPKHAEDIGIWSDQLVHSPRIAIVLQGPLKKEDDFTLETIKLYKKSFNEAIIILSTWDDENKSYIEKIRNEGIEVLLVIPDDRRVAEAYSKGRLASHEIESYAHSMLGLFKRADRRLVR